MKKYIPAIITVLIAWLPIYMGSWDNTLPADSTPWNVAAGYIRNNWDALEDGSATISYAPVYNVKAPPYNATGDGVADDTTALQAAADAAYAADGVLATLFLGAGNYLITDTVTFPLINVDFGGGKITYAGTRDRPAVVWGATATSPTQLSMKNVRIFADTLDWTTRDFVGLKIFNAARCYIQIHVIDSFTTNLQFYSVNAGIKHNETHLGQLLNAKYCIDLVCDGSGSGSFINENNYYGGDIGESSSTSALGDCYGLVYRQVSAGYTGNNNNRFYGPSFQMGDGIAGDERIPVLHDGVGFNNTIYAARYETGRGAFANFDDVENNDYDIAVLSGSYATATGLSTNDARMNRVRSARWWKDAPIQVQTVDLNQLITVYNGTTAQVSGPLHMCSSAGTVTFTNNGYTARLHSIEQTDSGRSLGFYAQTDGDEFFLLSQQAEDSSNLGRLMVGVFDSTFTRLTNVDPNHPYVVAQEFGSIGAWNASWGGVYTAGNDREYLVFRVHSDVKYIQVLVSGAVRLKSLSLARCTPSARPLHIFSGLNNDYTQRLTEGTLSTGVVGRFAKGNVLYNALAASGGATTSYWQCTTAGRLATAWAATTAYDVESIVENDSGKIYECVTAGTSA
ncbi:MAG: glycosyl hydrolase family 28-related protein, partial [Planctomycetota bacterium]